MIRTVVVVAALFVMLLMQTKAFVLNGRQTVRKRRIVRGFQIHNEPDKNIEVEVERRSIAATLNRLESDLKEFRTEVKNDIKGFRTEVKNDIKEFRTEVNNDIKEFRTEVNNDLKETNKKIMYLIIVVTAPTVASGMIILPQIGTMCKGH